MQDLAMLDMLCQHTLPELREHYTLWLVHHPDRLRRMLDLLTEALAVNYRSPATVDHIAWLRCFLAIEEALAGRLERVHEELRLVRGGQETDSVPKPNGKLRQQIQRTNGKNECRVFETVLCLLLGISSQSWPVRTG